MDCRKALKDEVYLEMAQTISKLSKDKQTQNGVALIRKNDETNNNIHKCSTLGAK